MKMIMYSLAKLPRNTNVVRSMISVKHIDSSLQPEVCRVLKKPRTLLSEAAKQPSLSLAPVAIQPLRLVEFPEKSIARD